MKHTLIIFKLILSTVLFAMFTPTSYAVGDSASPQIIDMVEYSVNVNTANAEEMATLLKGIGAKKAQAIIDYREANGPFTDVTQLTNVKGIGPSLINNNRDNLSVK
ncbi:ComEA family DNA-binding protein [Vibrio sp. RC27]